MLYKLIVYFDSMGPFERYFTVSEMNPDEELLRTISDNVIKDLMQEYKMESMFSSKIYASLTTLDVAQF